MIAPPGRPAGWRGPLRELERVAWHPADGGDPAEALQGLLARHGLDGPAGSGDDAVAVVLLLGAAGCQALAGLPPAVPSPVPAVPELVAVAVERGAPAAAPAARGGAVVGDWAASWTDAAHGAAVEAVRAAVARGEVYQANVVGHRSAPYDGDPVALAAAVAALPGAAYGGVLTGDGWAVGCASPEQLVRVDGATVTTTPVKGTSADREALRASAKDRAEHVMIVDLERNDLARVARTGTVEVRSLYDLTAWSGLWHAGSTVTAELRPGVGAVEVLRALVPGGSVTGAPKRAACALLAGLEPVGRGPAMGAFGLLHAGGLDLGLTIRTVALDGARVHLWAGGGITWGSDPAAEVAEAHAKAAPVLRALAAVPPR